jgi:hypothetical protein
MLFVATFLCVTLCFSRITMPKETYRWKGRIVTESLYYSALTETRCSFCYATL